MTISKMRLGRSELAYPKGVIFEQNVYRVGHANTSLEILACDGHGHAPRYNEIEAKSRMALANYYSAFLIAAKKTKHF